MHRRNIITGLYEEIGLGVDCVPDVHVPRFPHLQQFLCSGRSNWKSDKEMEPTINHRCFRKVFITSMAVWVSGATGLVERGLRASCDACIGALNDAFGVARSEIIHTWSVCLAVGKASTLWKARWEGNGPRSVLACGVPLWLVALCALVPCLVADAVLW